YRMASNNEDALKEINIAIASSPKNEYHLEKGLILTNLKKPQEALSEYDLVIKADPNNAVFRSYKALSMSDLSRFDDAVKECTESIRLDPKNPEYHFIKGNILYSAGRPEEASKEYQEA
ncbi:hypothetical protein B2A_01744, partial [mine drainage metagenome]